jgi:hypothetical protein
MKLVNDDVMRLFYFASYKVRGRKDSLITLVAFFENYVKLCSPINS